MTSSPDWRKIEAELEDWARGETRDDPVCYLERNTNSSEVALGDVQLITICDIDDPRGIRKLNLSSLARRLADTLTLRLTEPAPKADRLGTKAEASGGTCPSCGSTNTGTNPARCLDCGFGP